MRFTKHQKEPVLPPEALIVGLGNPGPQYSGTRHNIGFDVVEALAKKHGVALKTHKHQAQYGVGQVEGRPVAIVKPLTYMNLSGRSVAALAKSFGVGPERTLVVADDLDMEVGRVRMRAKGSSGGHNGHKSIIASLGSEDYPRLKIGIGKGQETIDHVLNKFKPDERDVIRKSVDLCLKGIETWLTDGIEKAMNEVNRKSDQDGVD